MPLISAGGVLVIWFGLAILAIVEFAQHGDTARAIGSSIGLLISAGAVGIVQVFAFRRWRPMYRLRAALKSDLPSAQFFVALLPKGASIEFGRGWPITFVPHSFPSAAVVSADSGGVKVWNTAGLPDPFLNLPWHETSKVTVAEYGDGSRAFAVLAIVSPGGQNALVMKVLRLNPALVTFADPSKLEVLAAQIDELRVSASL